MAETILQKYKNVDERHHDQSVRMNPRTTNFKNVDERHVCVKMDPSALNGNEIRQGRPLHQCNADCGPQLELRQGLQLSVFDDSC